MFIKCEKCGAIFNIDASLIKPGQRLRCSGCNYIFKYEPVQEGQKKEPAPLQSELPRIVVQSPVEQEPLSSAVNAPQFDRAPAVEKTPEPTIRSFDSVSSEQPANQSPSVFNQSADEIIHDKEEKNTQNAESASNNIPPVSVPEEFKPVANAPKSIPFLWILLTLIALISVGVGVLFLIPETLKQTVFLEKEIQQPVPPLPALDVIDTSFRIVPDQQNGVRLLVQGALFNPADKTQATHSFWIELFDANNTLIYTQEIIPVQKKIMGKSTLPFYTEITPVPDTVKRMDIVFK